MAKANSSAFLALKTAGLIAAVVGVTFYVLWAYLPLQDPPTYFEFADTRRIWGLANFWNVFSNVLFLHISLFGLIIFIRNYHAYDLGLWESFLVLNVSVFMICWGSSYFHLNPTPQAFIWDRLPLAIGFAGLVGFIFSDRVTDRYTRFLLPVLIALSVGSVLCIEAGPKDLRPYLVIQYGSILASLVMMFLNRRGRVSTRLILTSFAFYLLAKVSEYFDVFVYNFFWISGHTLNHLLVAVSVLLVNVAASKVHLKMKRDPA